MFEFLFKYSPVVYREGEWAFRIVPSLQWGLMVVGLVLLLLVLIYRRQVAPIPSVLKWTLAGLKSIALLLLLILLLEPFISITTVVPKKSSVLLLIDDSESMSIRDEAERVSREEKVRRWLKHEEGGILPALEENFNVLTYRFSDQVRAFHRLDELQAKGKATDLSLALDFARQQAEVHPISGVILVTDGVQTRQPAVSGTQTFSGKDPLQMTASLQQADVPVFTVGVGAEIRNDVQLTRVSVKKSVLEDDIVEMSVLIRTKKATGEKVTLQLLEDDRVVKSTDIVLDKKYTRVTLDFKPGRRGFLKYTAVVLPAKNELILTNNRKSFLVNHESRNAKILYIEELHPSEFKFIKRALDQDKSIQLVSMVRTGPDKFYRQGISHPRELADGFPESAEQLFRYQALIIGSIEASFFTPQQIQLIKDFVSRRGGGLLLLGGPKAFTAGGWDKTALTEILPVELISGNRSAYSESRIRYAPFKLQLTPEGFRSPILQFSMDAQENRKLWASMPELRSYNPLGAAKPGATVLAVHPLHQPERPKIILAEQKYGRGRTMVLATSTTWRWQMRLHSSDMRHEKFWRQIARWLAMSTPRPVEVALEKETYLPGEKVKLHISVLDSNFMPVQGAQISAEVSHPGQGESPSHSTGTDGDPPVGKITTLDVVPEIGKEGQYLAEMVPSDEGLYEVEILAHDEEGKYLGRAGAAFLVENQKVEFARPDLQENILRRIAEMTGGKYFHIDQAADLPDQLTITESTYSRIVEREIWDAPAVYAFILLVLAVEWFWRRSRGLS